MDTLTIFGLQLVLSLIVYALLAKWYVTPWLAEKTIDEGLIPLIVPHAFRHLGLAFLVPGLVAQPLPSSFAPRLPMATLSPACSHYSVSQPFEDASAWRFRWFGFSTLSAQ